MVVVNFPNDGGSFEPFTEIGRLRLDSGGRPAFAYVEPLSNELKVLGNDGVVRGRASNFAVGSQAPAATVRTYIAGTAIQVPTAKIQAGSCFRWRFSATKTAAGTAASTIDVAIGTAGTVADTAQL